MPNESNTAVVVYLDAAATPGDIRAVSKELDAIGIKAAVETGWPTAERGLELWSLIIAAETVWFMKAFTESAGKRAADSFGDFVGKLRKSRDGEARIEIGTPESGPVLIIMPGDPTEHFGSLELALENAPAGSEVRYDPERQIWTVAP